MTRAQITAFEAIAINRPPNCSRKTIGALLQRGVIASRETMISFRDGLPPAIVTNYYVPLPIHFQWWASEQFAAE